ncbi:barstar family protein [Solwaraspora sp. WMMD1047]|uniref:barstar family protein n=1 Tax=Solwaraspora sp. WMMD1047 TaxID=3016102 RepID=UPI002416F443|nr:barstar family protein [Solwaraspora sp. WMMD1047]MDG4828512.1 barstar family protein [Solwaraspora sp. WMMD1047]
MFDGRCEYADAARVWARWTSGTALHAGEWLRWPNGCHDDWLHVVQNSWFSTGRRAGRYGHEEEVEIHGSRMATVSGFYCELGEAVNGPGGYFGSNLDALADCVSSNYGGGRLVRVNWRGADTSRQILGVSFVNSVADLMGEFQVDLVLD